MHKGSYTDNSLLQSVSVRGLLQRYLTDETPKKKGAESETWRLLFRVVGHLPACAAGRRPAPV
jgi:hypothetical protein